MHSIRKWKKQSIVLICAGVLTTGAYAAENQDRFEAYNRSMAHFNDGLDKVVLTPVATGYQIVVPDMARKGIHNEFNNIDSIPVIINDVLQAKGNQCARDLWRLFFNMTFGVLGLVDVSSQMGLPKHSNDFGLTLAQWGYKNSSYFVLPVFGPSTVRDGLGLGVDMGVLSVYPYIHNKRVRYSAAGLDFIQWRADMLKYQNLIDQASLDPYLFQRDAYLQKRTHAVNNPSDKDAADDSNASNNDDPYTAEK